MSLVALVIAGLALDRFWGNFPDGWLRVPLDKTLALVMLAAVFVPLEKAFGSRRQRVLRAGWRADVVYFFLNSFFAMAGVLIALVTVGFWLRDLVPASVHHAILGQPYWEQFGEAFLLSEICEYWAHRAMHTVPMLWRFHKVHHSVVDMDWLASARLHPVDRAITNGAAYLPLLALRFSDVTLAAFGLFAAAQALASHANVQIGFGPLRYLVSTPQYHHWHHDRYDVKDKNFASKLPVVDLVFGSLYLPRRKWPTEYGIEEVAPATYLRQLAWPFASTREL